MSFQKYLSLWKNEDKEKRSSKRYNLITPAAIDNSRISHLVNTFDISETGCSFHSLIDFNQNEYLNLRFVYAGDSGSIIISQTPIEGKVIRLPEKGIREFGIQFCDSITEKNGILLIIKELEFKQN